MKSPLSSFFLLVAAILLKGAGSSYFLALMSLSLEKRGWLTGMIGLGHGVQLGAVLPVCLILPLLLHRLTLAQAIGVATALSLTGIGLMGLLMANDAPPPLLFYPLRFFIGMGLALSYLASESWLGSLAPEHRRGGLMGIYAATLGIGLGIGPLGLTLTGTEGALPYLTAMAAMLPIGLTGWVLRRRTPRLPQSRLPDIAGLFRLSPALLCAGIIFGVLDMGLPTLLPLYALALGHETHFALSLSLIGNLGAVLLQIPLAWLSDHIGRRRVLLASTALSALAMALMPWLSGSPLAFSLSVFAAVGLYSLLYTLVLVELGSQYAGRNIALASVGAILLFGIGSLAGPTLGGWAMDAFGPQGLPWSMTAACGLSLLVSLRYRLRS